MKTKRLTCGWLHEDGHLVLQYEKQDPDAGTVEWCEIQECPFPKLSINFKGRIVLHRYTVDGILTVLKMAKAIRLSVASVENGSENSKRLGLSLSSMTIDLSNGADLHWTFFPDIISDGITYQPDVVEQFADVADKGLWGSMPISKVIRKTIPAVEQAA